MDLVIESRPGTTVRARLAARGLRLTAGPLLSRWPLSPRALRPAFAIDLAATLALPAPRWARTERVSFGDFPAEWVWAAEPARPGGEPGDAAEPARTAGGAGDGDRVVLYFHGGGFFSCGLRTHRRLVARISAAAGAPVLSVAYRQLPAAPLAVSVDDCVRTYRWLLERGYAPERIVVAGDSAGGFLAFAATMRAMAEGLPAPGGIVALAPLTDLDHTGKVAHANAKLDAYLPARRVERLAGLLTGDAAPLDPMASPVNGPLEGLPPVLIQVGSTEMLLPDAELMAGRLARAGVPCRLQIWEGQVHVFQVFADLVPEGLAALHEVGAFIREHTVPRTVQARRRPRRRRSKEAAA